jgi:hypothetical protein
MSSGPVDAMMTDLAMSEEERGGWRGYMRDRGETKVIRH